MDRGPPPSQTTSSAIQVPAMGQRGRMALAYGPRTHPWFCDGRDLRNCLSFWEVEDVCMLISTSSLPFCAHSPKNTARPRSMQNTILSRFCIPNPALRAFAAVLQRDEGGFEFVASLLVRLQCCRCRVSRAEKYRNMLAHVSSCCPGRTMCSRRLCVVLLTMPTSSPLGLPLAQSSTCRHAITASDLVGPHEYADDVAPAEERSRSSQSHTCKTNLLEDTHLPLVLGAFPLSARNSGRMQAYSEVVKRHPEAWKIALPSHALSPFCRLQAIGSARRSRRHPRIGQRYVRDILYIVWILFWRESASAAMRRARSQARSLYGRQSLPKREGPLSARTPASKLGAAGLRPLRPRRNSASFRTFHYRRSPAVFETPCTS